MTSRRTTLFHVLLTLIISSVWIHLGVCSNSSLAEDFQKHVELNNQQQEFINDAADMYNIVPACELVYQQYLQAIENFTYCEIHNVRPFTLCLTCWKHYQAAAKLYAELNNNPHHEACKTRYMMSDIVQIIPTVQTNMDKMWRKSHCHRCFSKNDTVRDRVLEFLTLYKHFAICANASVRGDMKSAGMDNVIAANSSDPCIRCKSQYVALNANFNAMYNADTGDVCMDIMDMMNSTRIMWSSQFNCTSSSYDSTPVVVISCIVACTPIVFYVYLRITAKVRGAKLFKTKRLTTSAEISSRSQSTTDSSHSSHSSHCSH
ncbi:hypothetical protein BsWGS_13001 [Bradybaena similaris]